MSQPIISVHNLSKRYRLGQIGMTSLKDDVERLWHRFRRSDRRQRQSAAEEPSAKDFWALRDVSFDVQAGEVLGIIGKNGAGKSTLLKLLSRITEPTYGEAILRGRVASLLEVGTGFHPDLTGRENVYLNGTTLGMTKREIDRKFDEIVDFSGIEKFIDTPVKRYSSGMTVRLGFAVAAHLEPEILIVDEVLAVGDAEFQKRCLGKMQAVSQDLGRTVLFVSHNMNAVERICKRCLLLENGTITANHSNVGNVIHQYLKIDEKAENQNLWENSHQEYENPYFTPQRLKVEGEQSAQDDTVFSASKPITVTIRGFIEQPKHNLQIGFGLFHEDGALLFWSTCTDTDENHWPNLKPGLFELSSDIPSRLLNHGTYRVELFLGLHHEKWIAEPGVNAPGVSFSISGQLSDSPHWVETRPGLMAPTLEWNFKSIERHHDR